MGKGLIYEIVDAISHIAVAVVLVMALTPGCGDEKTLRPSSQPSFYIPKDIVVLEDDGQGGWQLEAPMSFDAYLPPTRPASRPYSRPASRPKFKVFKEFSEYEHLFNQVDENDYR